MKIVNQSLVKTKLDNIKNDFPDLYKLIDRERYYNVLKFIKDNYSQFNDFDTELNDSRGKTYIEAQNDYMVRGTGIKNIFSYMPIEETDIILDCLGGNGLLNKVLNTLYSKPPKVITSDISKGMIKSAIDQGFMAIRQPAQYLSIKDASINGVILAYGTHHIPLNERNTAVKESKRVLRSGGTFLIHDFEEGKQAARWFSEVVDKYSITGHDFPHFTKEEILNYLKENSFLNLVVKDMYDPFVFYGTSEENVTENMVGYLMNMYGLYKGIGDEIESFRHFMTNKAYDIFRYDKEFIESISNSGTHEITITKMSDGYKLEIPRVAIIGIGNKY